MVRMSKSVLIKCYKNCFKDLYMFTEFYFTCLFSYLNSIFVVTSNCLDLNAASNELFSLTSEALPLRNFVKTLIRSPVYFLRQLSSAAFVSLVPQIVTMETIEELVTELLKSKEANFIHGAMVSMEMLINRCNE